MDKVAKEEVKYPFRERDICQSLYLGLLRTLDKIDDPNEKNYKMDNTIMYFKLLERTIKCDSFHDFSDLRNKTVRPILRVEFSKYSLSRSYHRDFIKESLNLWSVISYYSDKLKF